MVLGMAKGDNAPSSAICILPVGMIVFGAIVYPSCLAIDGFSGVFWLAICLSVAFTAFAFLAAVALEHTTMIVATIIMGVVITATSPVLGIGVQHLYYYRDIPTLRDATVSSVASNPDVQAFFINDGQYAHTFAHVTPPSRFVCDCGKYGCSTCYIHVAAVPVLSTSFAGPSNGTVVTTWMVNWITDISYATEVTSQLLVGESFPGWGIRYRAGKERVFSPGGNVMNKVVNLNVLVQDAVFNACVTHHLLCDTSPNLLLPMSIDEYNYKWKKYALGGGIPQAIVFGFLVFLTCVGICVDCECCEPRKKEDKEDAEQARPRRRCREETESDGYDYSRATSSECYSEEGGGSDSRFTSDEAYPASPKGKKY